MPRAIHKLVGDVFDRRVRPGILKYSVGWFLGALSLLFLSAPFVEELDSARMIEPVLFTVALSCAVLAVGGRRRVLVMAILLVIPTLAMKWLSHLGMGRIPEVAFPIGGMVFTAFVTTHLMLFVLRAKRVNSEVLCAGIAVYLLISLCWAFIYTLVAQANPHAFVFTAGPPPSGKLEGFNVVYFSLVSLNTAAFGDIVPASGTARMVAMAETTVGVFYLAVLISRLVALYAPGAAQAPPVPSSQD